MLILVEGIKDRGFLNIYLKHLKIDRFTIFEIEGKDNLENKFNEEVKIDENKKENLRTRVNKAIKEGEAIKIIFDVDKSYKESKENIERQLEDIEKDLSKKCEIFLFPNDKDVSDDEDNANLETIFETIAIEKEVFNCLKASEECLKTCSISKEENRRNFRKVTNKDTLYAYLHVFGYKIDNKDPDPEIETISKLLNLEHKYLQPLRKFLKNEGQAE